MPSRGLFNGYGWATDTVHRGAAAGIQLNQYDYAFENVLQTIKKEIVFWGRREKIKPIRLRVWKCFTNTKYAYFFFGGKKEKIYNFFLSLIFWKFFTWFYK